VKDQRVSVQFRCIQNSEKGQFPAYLKTPAVSQHIPLAIVPVLLQQMVSLKGQEEEKLEMKKLGEKRRPNLGSRSLTQPRLEKQTADKELLLNSPKKFENPEIITRATRLSKRTKKPEISGKSSEQIQDVLLGNLTDNYQEKLTHPEKEIFHPEQYSTFEQSEHNQHNLLLEIILNLLKKFLEKYLRWNLIVKKVK